jgi:hypothetical protein
VPRRMVRALIGMTGFALALSGLAVVAPAGAAPDEVTMTILVDGAPINGAVRVYAYTQDGVTHRWDNQFTSATTDPSGVATLGGFNLGEQYRFCYQHEWDSSYRMGCYGSTYAVDATTVEFDGPTDLGTVDLTKKDTIDLSGLRIQGKAVVGQRLTLNTEILNPTPDFMLLHWGRDGGLVAGNYPKGQELGQGVSYVIQPEDVGHQIFVGIQADGATARGPELFPGSGPISLVPGTAVVVQPMGFTGAPKVRAPKWRKGKTARYVAPEQIPAGATVTFQWLRNGKVIKGATKATHKINRKDRKKRLSVRATYVSSGFETTTMESAPSPRVK